MPTKVNIKVPRSLWTKKDSARLASNTLASIKLRTSKGIDANGEEFDEYSTTPIYVALKGARLKPKGGEKTKSGNSIFYQNGYQQYKQDSRRRGGGGDSAEVDLVLSGNMMNNLIVKETTATSFTIGLTNKAQYGYIVNQKREFLGLSQDDIDVLVKTVELEIRKKLL